MKIAFLVESEFCERHFGVRNFFNTIKSVLQQHAETEYITCSQSHSGNLWYRVLPSKKADEIKTLPVSLKSSKISYTEFKKQLNGDKKNQKKQYYYFQYLGQNLDNENYDTVIITNPWLINLSVNIKANKIFGIVHDFVPNLYYLYNKAGLEFGNAHYTGYTFYNTFCSKIVANSSEIRNQYINFFPNIDKTRIDYLKPFPTFEFKDAKFDETDKKENAVILAAPFDLRKGLKKIPKILNSVSSLIDKLYIFGRPRCDEKDFNDFWSELAIKNVLFTPEISYEDLISTYKRCKILLFPSLEEGLGIPIIEAQICGCRVVTTDASPMRDLLVQGGYLLTENAETDKNNISRMFSDDFDYAELSKKSREFFAYADIVDKIIGD